MKIIRANIKKIFLIGTLMLFSFILFSCVWYIFLMPNPIFELTEPLDNITKIDLCNNLQISPRDKRCTEAHDTYANAFYTEISNLVDNGGLDSHDDWVAMFGAYETRCQERDDIERLVCRYDFKGDGVFFISVFYDKNGNFVKIFFQEYDG